MSDILTEEDWKNLLPHYEKYPHMIQYHLERHSEPFGYSKFKGDKAKLFGDMDLLFTKGNNYPVYWDGEGEFVIGNDRKPYKLTPPTSWTKIK